MNEKNRYLVKLSVLMSIPILFSEYLFRTTIVDVLRWIVVNPLLFLVNLTLLMALALVFGVIFRDLCRGIWFIFAGSSILGIVNGNKMNLRSVPFQPKDMLLVREFFALTPSLVTPLSIALLLLAGPALYGLYRLIRKWFGDNPYENLKFLTLTALAVFMGVLLMGQVLYAEAYGPFELGFIYSFPRALVQREPDLSLEPDDVEDELLNGDESPETPDPPEPQEQKPNVIVFMSEAFWDINLLDADFSPNPIQHFENLREESIHGQVYVPVFGGGTANTEFEVLTGISLKTYAADWHIIYRNEIYEPVPSLASIFKDEDYRTEALHPYHHWYYRRDEVFPLLGFDRFTALKDMEDPPTLGPFVTDEYLTDLLIDQIEESDEPLFNYTLTMQNHAPFHEQRNEPVVSFEHDLNERQETMLQTYADGLYFSDRELKRLVDYLRDSDEPTLLLFFGDHLPMFGNNFDLYRSMGYLGEETPEELQDDLRLHTVPYILWANYPLETGEMPLQNATALPLLVLEHAGVEKPLHMQLVEVIHDRAPLIQNDHYTDAEGNRYDRESDEYQEIIEQYRSVRNQAFEEQE